MVPVVQWKGNEDVKYCFTPSDGIMSFNGTTVVGSDDTVQKAIDAGKSLIMLTECISDSINIPSGSTVTLDLNGYIIRNDGDGNTITVQGALNLIDSSLSKTGDVINTGSGQPIFVDVGGILNRQTQAPSINANIPQGSVITASPGSSSTEETLIQEITTTSFVTVQNVSVLNIDLYGLDGNIDHQTHVTFTVSWSMLGISYSDLTGSTLTVLHYDGTYWNEVPSTASHDGVTVTSSLSPIAFVLTEDPTYQEIIPGWDDDYPIIIPGQTKSDDESEVTVVVCAAAAVVAALMASFLIIDRKR